MYDDHSVFLTHCPRRLDAKAPAKWLGLTCYLTYSMTTRRLGSTPVEWVVMFSMSCRAA